MGGQCYCCAYGTYARGTGYWCYDDHGNQLSNSPPSPELAARIVGTHPLGDGAARLPERARSPTPHTSTCGAPPTLRARPNIRDFLRLGKERKHRQTIEDAASFGG